MLADDVFRKELAATTQKLAAWAAGLRETGQFDIREGHGFWSLAARPQTPGACAVTLVLRADQKFDLSLDGSSFEDQNIEDLSVFPALIEAVGVGHVERTASCSALTGLPLAVETRVLFHDGRVWSRRREINPPLKGDEAVEDTARYLPYRR